MSYSIQEQHGSSPLEGPANAKIEVKDLNFYYGQFHALKKINMFIKENKVTAFIGPSGYGKSTLLRTLNRMFELYPGQRAEGQILLDGEDLITYKLDILLIHELEGIEIITSMIVTYSML